MTRPPESTTVRVGDLELAYRRRGTGSPLVLLHGAASDGRMWRPQLAGLADALDVIAWDEPGAGASSDPPDDLGLADYAGAVAGLIETLECAPAHVGGLSWGGTVALELHRLHPECVRSLIFTGAYAGWKGSLPPAECEERLALALSQASAPAGEFAPTLPGLFRSDPEPDVVAELEAIMADSRPGPLRRMATEMAACDLTDHLARIDVPVLLVWGEEDRRSPLRVAEQFRDAIAGAELVVIPNAGHVSNLERPEAFNRAVRDFCRSR